MDQNAALGLYRNLGGCVDLNIFMSSIIHGAEDVTLRLLHTFCFSFLLPEGNFSQWVKLLF